MVSTRRHHLRPLGGLGSVQGTCRWMRQGQHRCCHVQVSMAALAVQETSASQANAELQQQVEAHRDIAPSMCEGNSTNTCAAKRQPGAVRLPLTSKPWALKAMSTSPKPAGQHTHGSPAHTLSLSTCRSFLSVLQCWLALTLGPDSSPNKDPPALPSSRTLHGCRLQGVLPATQMLPCLLALRPTCVVVQLPAEKA